jgi:predicted glutamine amidotransferase
MLEISFQKLIGRADRGNPDGWGAVFYEKNDAYVFREPRPASDSRLASLLGQCGVESHLIISHIRRATTGSIELKNTHSFTREIQGRLHSFAFNGNVHDVFELELLMDRFSPIGETDGEFAFSWILEQLMIEAVDGNWKDTAAVQQSCGTQLVEMGPQISVFRQPTPLCLCIATDPSRRSASPWAIFSHQGVSAATGVNSLRWPDGRITGIRGAKTRAGSHCFIG